MAQAMFATSGWMSAVDLPTDQAKTMAGLFAKRRTGDDWDIISLEHLVQLSKCLVQPIVVTNFGSSGSKIYSACSLTLIQDTMQYTDSAEPRFDSY